MSSSSSALLPTPRQLLTSLVNAISEIPAPAPAPAPTTTRQDPLPGRTPAQSPNPLRLIDPAHRPLFATLHVLFPSLLLPALDLLDRGLVTRLVRAEETTGRARHGEGQGRGRGHRAHETTGRRHGHVQGKDGDGGSGARGDSITPSSSSSAYLVRSGQKTLRRHRYDGGSDARDPSASSPSSSSSYVVHTTAWNCTCAAFALSAFAPVGPPPPPPPVQQLRGAAAGAKGKEVATGIAEEMHMHMHMARYGDDGCEKWEFGGMSLDGTGLDGNGECVPSCCKHLLACVLAERWEAVLGRYVVQRKVGREEMAGIFADV